MNHTADLAARKSVTAAVSRSNRPLKTQFSQRGTSVALGVWLRKIKALKARDSLCRRFRL
jgi:hypothetical protein